MLKYIRYLLDKNMNIVFPVTHEKAVRDSNNITLETKLGQKQETLVSGINIKTINNASILGSGNITVQTEITVDDVPTSGSNNPVKSGGVYTALSAKQDTISDLTTIRSGASAGATAYQKPSDGIPFTDMSSAVVALLNKTIASISSQQDGSLVFTFQSGDTVTIDLNHVHTQYNSKVAETTQPSGGFLPDVVYKLGTLTGTVTFLLAAAVTGNINHYFWTFDTGSTAPTVTWPSGITWADGTGPTVAASKHYEISILDGIATFAEV